MGWLDDARKKAEETAEDAKTKAAEKAAEAAVAAAGAAVSKSVGGFFEGIVSSAEASLAEAQEDAKGRGLKLDGPEFDEADAAAETVQSDIDTPVADPLGDAVRRVEARAFGEAPASVAPPPVRSSDPFADAEAAIRMAREARGLDPNPPEPILPDRSNHDPVASALAAAAEARAMASSGGAAAMAREEAAREQLAALKAAHGFSPRNDRDDPESDDDAPASAKKRTL